MAGRNAAHSERFPRRHGQSLNGSNLFGLSYACESYPSADADAGIDRWVADKPDDYNLVCRN